MVKYDARVDEKIAGSTWDNIRDKLVKVHEVLLGVHESAASELTTIYIKYKAFDEPLAPVFAVMWIKTAKQVVLGLSTPEMIRHENVIDAPPGMKYKGLTSYLKINDNQEIPEELGQWARVAFNHAKELN